MRNGEFLGRLRRCCKLFLFEQKIGVLRVGRSDGITTGLTGCTSSNESFELVRRACWASAGVPAAAMDRKRVFVVVLRVCRLRVWAGSTGPE